jgi:hypothetical protein
MFKWLTFSRLVYIIILLAIILMLPTIAESITIQIEDWKRELGYYRQGPVFHA